MISLNRKEGNANRKRKMQTCFLLLFLLAGSGVFSQIKKEEGWLARPLSVYINWAAYDELSDTVRLTEAKAMAQLAQLKRLQQQGAQFDYFMMDAFWFERTGLNREWRKASV